MTSVIFFLSGKQLSTEAAVATPGWWYIQVLLGGLGKYIH